MRAERAEQRTEQRSAAARANAPVEEAHRPIEEEEISQLDIVDDDNVYHGNDDDEEECVGSETMDVDDDEEEQKVDEEEEEQGGVDVLRTVVLKRGSKLALKDTDLYTYFFNLLESMSCPTRSCGCLEIMRDLNARSAIAKYLTWFECRHKHKQDSIVFEWVRYVLILKASNEQRKGMKNRKVFRLPFVDDGTDVIDDNNGVRTHLLCKRGLVRLLTFGERRFASIRSAAMSSAVLPDHKSIGKKNYNNVKKMSVSIGLSCIILST